MPVRLRLECSIIQTNRRVESSRLMGVVESSRLIGAVESIVQTESELSNESPRPIRVSNRPARFLLEIAG